VCTKGRDVINTSWWLVFTGNSSFKGNNFKPQSQSWRSFMGLPSSLEQGKLHALSFSVARVRPRTSKGITDLLLLRFVVLKAPCPSKKLYMMWRWTSLLFNRLESRSLSELTRQIAPPTKNGHAPPSTESRKSSQSVNPFSVRAGWVSPCWVKLSRRLHSWWCPSVNSFKFQLCNHTSPGTVLRFPGAARRVKKTTQADC
jgi:hypothetical protein